MVSYYYDKETGLYYLITRYYDPEVGRFISADDPKYLDFTMAYGHNRYAYCVNNPVMYVDPSGCFWDYIIDGVFILWGIWDLINGGYDDRECWAALGIDVVLAVCPYVMSGAGRSVKVLNATDNVGDLVKAYNQADNVADMVKSVDYLDNTGNAGKFLNYSDDIVSVKEVGTYILKNADGNVVYVGKGSRARMMKNYKRFSASSFLYYSSSNSVAFANEAFFMASYGGARSMNDATQLFNKINSPGLGILFHWF